MLEILQRSLAFEKRHLFGDEIDVRFAIRFAVALLGQIVFTDGVGRYDLYLLLRSDLISRCG